MSKSQASVRDNQGFVLLLGLLILMVGVWDLVASSTGLPSIVMDLLPRTPDVMGLSMRPLLSSEPGQAILTILLGVVTIAVGLTAHTHSRTD